MPNVYASEAGAIARMIDTYTVRASAKGYETKELSEVEIAESQLNTLDIELVRVALEPLPEPD